VDKSESLAARIMLEYLAALDKTVEIVIFMNGYP
jgi:hypothetical protein